MRTTGPRTTGPGTTRSTATGSRPTESETTALEKTIRERLSHRRLAYGQRRLKMSLAITKASRLKPEIRLAQAVSEFEADLSTEQKATFRTNRSKTISSPPTSQDVMRLTAEIDRGTGNGNRCLGPRLTNVLQAVQKFAALGDIIIGGSQNLVACGIWTIVRTSLLVSHRLFLQFSSSQKKGTYSNMCL